MKIKSNWKRKWHDDQTTADGLTIFLEAWHDDKMGVGLIVVSYSEQETEEAKVLERFAYVGDYRQTIQRAMGIWSKEIPRFLKTIREEDEPEEEVAEEAE